MPSTDREGSRDRDLVVKHQHSWSSVDGRSNVPMWDSSDPDRAPPPLPLNPGSQSPTTKPNTSSAIAAAAARITESARAAAPLSSYTRNTPGSETSPERSLIKGAHHKRMQTFSSNNVRDLRAYLDGNRRDSQDRSPERPKSQGGANLTPYSNKENAKDYMSAGNEKSADTLNTDTMNTPTPTRATDPFKDTPSLRPTTRNRSIYGENTPPSATMLALQTMQVPEPFSDITNANATVPTTPSANSAPRVHNNYDFSSQLLNLTSIATNLQREMAQLSRRSKDNATDLVSLKEATNARDEDIRKSLKDLSSAWSTTQNLLEPPPKMGSDVRSRSASTFAASHYLDNKIFSSPPSATKSWNLPRAASAHSFLDDPREGSPSPWSVEGAASVAMLEKIIREMVTKEGQDRLLSTLSELMDKSSKDNVEAAKKVEELADFIKQKSESQALVPVTQGGSFPRLDLNFDTPRALARTPSADTQTPKVQDFAKDGEAMKLLQRIKDSVLHAGGTTVEVKNIVRDLRGEVLGMGRELGRKIDQVSEASLNSTLDRSIENQQGSQSSEDVQRILEEGISELKEHLAGLLDQNTRDQNTQLATDRSLPSSDETYEVVKAALADHASNQLIKAQPESEGLDRDTILETVKEGLKDFEPNIELQQYGLERDEILVVLKEGFEDYAKSRPETVHAPASIDKADVFEAIQEALKDFQLPTPKIEDHLEQIKDELVANVQQALADFQPSTATSDVNNAAIIEAVRETLAEHGPNAPREIEISREDLFDAVKASLDGTTIPFGGFGEQVLSQLRELVDGMKVEFKQYSAANGRDTEQVLDAVKDGLEVLRGEVESYVDRAQDVTGKDEIVDTVKTGLEQLRADVQGYVAQGPEDDSGKRELLEYVKAEFEHLHETLGTSRGEEGGTSGQTAEIILAVRQGMDDITAKLDERGSKSEMEDEDHEEMMEAMKEEFEQLKAALLNAHATDKGEMMETIQDSMGALHARLNGSELSQSHSGGSEQVMREEFATLKEMLHAGGMGEEDRDAIISAIRQSIEDLRTQLAGDQGDAHAEAIGTIKAELEAFRESMGSSLVLGSTARGLNLDGEKSAGTSHDALEGVRVALQELKDATGTRSVSEGGVPTELLEAIRGEFENLRGSIATSVVHGGSNEEVLDAVRLGLDDLRSDMQKKLDNPELGMGMQNDLLDAMNEGLETMKSDLVKTIDKPLDMTVNYEILDTLKDGLAGLRTDMDKLRSGVNLEAPGQGAIVLAEPGVEGESSRNISADNAAAPQGVKKTDLEKMEVLLAQLQIKIEAMDATVQDLPDRLPHSSASSGGTEGMAMKDDLLTIEAAIRETQDAVAVLTARASDGPPPPEGCAMKEDTDAIETILRNTKAQLEELQMPDPETAVTREQMENVEVAVRLAHETIDAINDKLDESVAKKDDVAVVEVLAQDVKTALDEIKEKMLSGAASSEDDERVTKTDFDVLGVICTEIKTKISEMSIPDAADMPSKADLEQLQGLVTDFRESHDKMKESYENDIAITAKAFDDRKQESDALTEQVMTIKEYLEEVKEELLTKLGDGDSGVNTLGETIKSMEEKLTATESLRLNVEELVAKVGEEFEKAHGSLEDIKADHAQTFEAALEKHAEHKVAVVDELGAKLDTLFDGMMTKYDDAQTAAEASIKDTEERIIAQEELMTKTQAMAEELRVSIDTLGGTLTMFCETLPSKMDAMEEQSKTVFAKAEETSVKIDDVHTNLLGEHASAKEQVVKVLAAVDGVQSDLTEHNPRFMVKLEELAAVIGQHWELSQKSSEAAEQHASAVRELQEQIRGLAEDSRSQAEGLMPQFEELKSNISGLPTLMPPPIDNSTGADKYDDSAVHQKLDQLIGHAEVPRSEPEEYNDTAVHEKLDKLMGQVEDAGNSSAQLERLDQIHDKVIATAAEVSAFVAMQTKQIMNDHESKEKEAEEIGLLLERRSEQRDHVEAEITVMSEEKEALQAVVDQLRAEKEALTAHKSRLSADVSSLETALHIRKDELHEMDAKAEAIERRMLESVMNQSRMLLLAKTAQKPAPPSKKKPGRDLRIPSTASDMSTRTATSTVPALKNGHAMALKTRQQQSPAANAAERRIMSLSQINSNVPTGAHAYKSPAPSLASTGVKRSHSVKSQYLQRKASWGAAKRMSLGGVQNKENHDTLSEEDEEDLERPQSRDDAYLTGDDDADRRTSYASGTGSVRTYDTGSYLPSGESDLSYGTGSYMTGSELDRRTSLGSTVNGHVDGEGHESLDSSETDEEQEATLGAQEDEADEPLRLEAPPAGIFEHAAGDKPMYAPPSDSGLGTDLPTANIAPSEGDYFK